MYLPHPPAKEKTHGRGAAHQSHQGLTLRSNDATVTRTSKKRNMRVCKQKNNFARASRVFVHFFAVSARLRRENGYFRVLWRTQTSNDEILFLFLNLDVVPRNSTSGGFAYIWQSKWVGIIAIKTERMQSHFLSDVLIAAASLDLDVPGRPFSLWGVNCRFWSHLGCLGWRVTIFAHSGYRLALCVNKSTKTKALTLTTDKSPLRVSLSLRHTHIGLP